MLLALSNQLQDLSLLLLQLEKLCKKKKTTLLPPTINGIIYVFVLSFLHLFWFVYTAWISSPHVFLFWSAIYLSFTELHFHVSVINLVLCVHLCVSSIQSEMYWQCHCYFFFIRFWVPQLLVLLLLNHLTSKSDIPHKHCSHCTYQQIYQTAFRVPIAYNACTGTLLFNNKILFLRSYWLFWYY